MQLPHLLLSGSFCLKDRDFSVLVFTDILYVIAVFLQVTLVNQLRTLYASEIFRLDEGRVLFLFIQGPSCSTMNKEELP